MVWERSNSVRRQSNAKTSGRDQAAATIQALYRGERDRREFEEMKEKDAAVREIQNIHRGNTARNEFDGLQRLGKAAPTTGDNMASEFAELDHTDKWGLTAYLFALYCLDAALFGIFLRCALQYGDDTLYAFLIMFILFVLFLAVGVFRGTYSAEARYKRGASAAELETPEVELARRESQARMSNASRRRSSGGSGGRY